MSDGPDQPGDRAERLTVEAALAGRLHIDDVRMTPEALRHQAEVAAADGNRQLGENFLRAAELTAVDDEDVLDLYEALRPGRASAAELAAWADRLDTLGAVRCSALVREAAAVYQRRGLLRR